MSHLDELVAFGIVLDHGYTLKIEGVCLESVVGRRDVEKNIQLHDAGVAFRVCVGGRTVGERLRSLRTGTLQVCKLVSIERGPQLLLEH